MLLLAACLAHAAEPPVSEEVVVYDELRVEQARRELIETLRRHGYTRIKRRDDRVVLRHEQAWKGKIVLFDAGWLEVRRQGVRFDTPPTWLKEHAPALSWMPCITQPSACFRLGGVVLSPRKMQQVKTRAVRAAAPDLQDLGDRIADRAVSQHVADLPERLTACWEAGEPLLGGDPLPTPEARRAELLAFWESRTDTVWGERVRTGVEAFVHHVVQASPHPYPEEEISSFNERNRAARPFALRVP